MILFLIAVFLFAVLLLVWGKKSGEGSLGSQDDFARCLAGKNVVMYGANWCPHCQNEKKAFGDSFRLVPYVECPEDPQRCLAAGIAGYPTWIFPDGNKFEGEQGLKRLSQESGCPLGD